MLRTCVRTGSASSREASPNELEYSRITTAELASDTES
jgi:hypothetical protein